MIDTRLEVETPEGVELSLPVAGPVSRGQAWALDALIKLMVVWGGAIVPAILGNFGVGLFFLYTFCVYWLYSVFFEWLGDGATPGKRVVGLRVLHDNGTPVGWQAATIRSLVGFADWLPMFYAVGLVSVLAHPSFKRLGDLAAGTVVVHVEKRAARAWEHTERPQPPPVPLLPEEQRALIEFAERAATLTDERRDELAEIVRGLTSTEGDRCRQLLAQAAWVAGHR